MRALLQRVTRSSVTVGDRVLGSIGPGLVVLAGVRKGDTEEDCEWLARKIVGLRIFSDEAGRMNRSVLEAGGGVLLVSQFTLYGDTRKGRRPSFDAAARPEEAVPLLASLRARIEGAGVPVAEGEFGAHMIVELVNDGPVTILLDSVDRTRSRREPREDAGPQRRLHLVGSGSALAGRSLILASASPRRRDLLANLEIPFVVEPADVDETDVPAVAPERQVLLLAERKARSVAAGKRTGLVLGADTIVVVGEQALGKPRDGEEALAMLRALAGREHRVLTGVCVVDAATGWLASRFVGTRVRFHPASEEELRRYVETGEPLGKAGAYAIQGHGGLLVAGIDGDYSNVVGLPVGATLDLLAQALSSGEQRSEGTGSAAGGGSVGGRTTREDSA